jgi:uncharacterized membrane protein
MEIINDYSHRVDELRKTGYRVNIEEYIRQGLWIFRQKPELFVIYAALILVSFPMGGFLFSGPLTAGFFIVAHRITRGQSVIIDHFFDGFKNFIPLFLLVPISAIIISIGFAFFIIPGIYLSIAYTFAIFFIIFGKTDFWEGMELSRKLVSAEWFNIFGLTLILGLINFIGALAFGVGLLFSIPISFCALYAAFDDIIGADPYK